MQSVEQPQCSSISIRSLESDDLASQGVNAIGASVAQPGEGAGIQGAVANSGMAECCQYFGGGRHSGIAATPAAIAVLGLEEPGEALTSRLIGVSVGSSAEEAG